MTKSSIFVADGLFRFLDWSRAVYIVQISVSWTGQTTFGRGSANNFLHIELEVPLRLCRLGKTTTEVQV